MPGRGSLPWNACSPHGGAVREAFPPAHRAGAASLPMRLPIVTGAFALALLLPPGAAGFVADAPLAPAPPRQVHPVVGGGTGYGETAARFGGPRGGRSHAGQDVFAPAGTPLVAAADGVVLETGSGDGRGYHLALYSRETGQTYLYYHLLKAPLVRAGDRVTAGQKVGLVGCSGSCWGDHLHFEVRDGRGIDGRASDPLPLLQRWSKSG